MTRRPYRSVAMAAVSFTVLAMAGGAEAQTKRHIDCRWEPNRPLAQQRYLGPKDCMAMRRDADVRTTGAVTRTEGRRVRTGPAMRSGAVAQVPGGAVMGTPM